MTSHSNTAKVRVVLNLEQWQMRALEEWHRQHVQRDDTAAFPPDALVSSFDLPKRIKTTLAENGILRLDQLLQRDPAELMDMPGLSYRGVVSIRKFLAKLGLSFAKRAEETSVIATRWIDVPSGQQPLKDEKEKPAKAPHRSEWDASEYQRQTVFEPPGASDSGSLMPFSSRFALKEIDSLMRLGRPLTHLHYAWLCEAAHTAYLVSNRDFVRSDLLGNILAAFGELRRLLTMDNTLGRNSSKTYQDGDTLMIGGRLTDGVNESFDSLQRRPVGALQNRRDIAVQLSRNLALLRCLDELPEAKLNDVLRSFASGLYLLATRAYLLIQGCPFEDSDSSRTLADMIGQLQDYSFENELAIVQIGGSDLDISVIVLEKNGAWELRCGYQTFEDFVHVINLPRSGSSEEFILEAGSSKKAFRLSAKRSDRTFRCALTEAQFAQLRSLIRTVVTDVRFVALIPHFQACYGAL